jgi:diguanylate cyclase (GGDEF)-like protein
MNEYWRRAIGPLVTLAAAGIFLLAPGFRDAPPAPGALLLAAIVFATLLGGTMSGLFSAMIGIVCGSYALSDPAHWLLMSPQNLFRFILVTSFGLGVPIMVAWIRARAERLLAREKVARAKVESANRDLMVLQAALDKVDHGVLLLDENLRVDFMNDAFRNIWALEAGETNERTTFAELVRRAGHKIDAVYPFDIGAADYTACRVALVREGREDPVDLRLSSGRTVRVQCKRMASGGRLVTYTDVTDLVHQSEAFERLATTDDLTGVCNRRHFIALGERAFAASRAERTPLALLILDIDLFKSINDRFGHDVGDTVIRHVASVCRELKREGDVLARIGGEEFTLLLPGTDIEEAEALAGLINLRLVSHPVTVNDHKLGVTASIGVATAGTTTGALGDLMRRADQALYAAKRAGRNRVQRAVEACANPDQSSSAAA